MSHTLKSSWPSKKGAVLSIDVAVAIFIASITLATAFFYLSNVEDEPITRVNMYRAMRDITSILDHNGTLATMNKTIINNALDRHIPGQYNAEIEMFVHNMTAGSMQYVKTNNTHNYTNGTLMSGVRIMVIDNHPVEVKYWIWLK